MVDPSRLSAWRGADAYDAYMGRWSRPLARAFLAWFAVPEAGRWLDVGCGTGALTAAVLAAANPRAVTGVDPSANFIEFAKATITDSRAHFDIGDARALPVDSHAYDAVVAGLVLNHLPDPISAVAEMARAARPNGAVAVYVWDYSGNMQMMRLFWEAVAATDAAAVDPRSGYRICQPEPLADLLRGAGLDAVTVEAIDLPMRFRDLEDYWRPHTMPGPAAAQRYVGTLDDGRRAALREQLRVTLPIAADGAISLIGRAWAGRGTKLPD
jgi:SAM-dependent methyltransferase